MIAKLCIHIVNYPSIYRWELRFLKNYKRGVTQDFLVKLVISLNKGLPIEAWEGNYS